MGRVCERCGEREASFYASFNINGNVKQFALCQECLAELTGQQGPGNTGNPGFNPFGGGSFGDNGAGGESFFGDFGPGFGGAETGQQTLEQGNGSMLDQFTRDLTKDAKKSRLDPVIGRDEELQRMLQILGRKTKNNPVLVGDPGVGKTAIVEALAQRIARGEVPENLANTRLLMVDLAGMLAGSKLRGAFEERFKGVIDEAIKSQNTILFIDELHTILGAGAPEGGMDAANLIKPALARGELQCIGATTLNEYRKYIEKDGALARRFQPVMVDEPTVEETVAILNGLAPVYADHHKVRYSDEVLEYAARLADRYINDRFLPDKAIDVIDEAGTIAVLRKAEGEPDEVDELKTKLKELEERKAALAAAEQFEEAATVKKQETEVRAQLEKLSETGDDNGRPAVTISDISRIVSNWSGVPVGVLSASEARNVSQLAEHLKERVIGQDRAVEAVASAIKRGKAGMKELHRPIGSFLFLGPTGVGKTELAKALATELFGDPDDLIVLDMSEYMERHSTSRLVGAPPGYVGYDEAGQLTEAVRRKPYSVVLFDEFEKAHPEVQNVLLQLLEEGRLTDSKGRKVDFSNTVVILTSNLGTSNLDTNRRVGFANSGDSVSIDDYRDRMLQAAGSFLKPEFVNRLDAVIVFNPIHRDALYRILDLRLGELADRVKSTHNLDVQFGDKLRELLIERGYSRTFGARQLRRVIRRTVEDALADYLLARGENEGSGTLSVDFDGEQVVVKELVPAAAA